MFAEHYKPVETTPQLPSGVYEAKIVKAELKQLQWGEKIEVTIEIENHLGAKPNRFDLLDEPKKDYPNYPLERQLESYNKNMTRFFDGFGITRGNFTNFEEWLGKSGNITIHPQANASGYMEITPFTLSERELSNRIKKADEAQKKAKENKSSFEAPGVPPAPQTPQGDLNNFPDEVPS